MCIKKGQFYANFAIVHCHSGDHAGWRPSGANRREKRQF